jgi:hypothetical protein
VFAALCGATKTEGSAPGSIKASPRYEVRVALEFSSPFVPDGRMSVAEFSLQAVFSGVVLEFDPKEDPLLGRCQINAEPGKGVFTKLVLNDVQVGEKRQSVLFTTARPAEFPVKLAVESEPTEEEEAAARSSDPPEKIRLSFWTEFSPGAVKWASKFGSAGLEDFRVTFEVPFRKLIEGKGCIITFPCEGRYPEDKGSWTIEWGRSPKSHP